MKNSRRRKIVSVEGEKINVDKMETSKDNKIPEIYSLESLKL
jgi:hypothetical protein